MRHADLPVIALGALVLAALPGCQHQHLATTQIHFDNTMRYVNGTETPVTIDFEAPAHHPVQIELIDGTVIEGTLHAMEPTAIAKYASVPVSLDFQTLADLKSHRGTARVVVWEPEDFGEAPYAIHLEKGQSPETVATEEGHVLAILDLRRVN